MSVPKSLVTPQIAWPASMPIVSADVIWSLSLARVIFFTLRWNRSFRHSRSLSDAATTFGRLRHVTRLKASLVSIQYGRR
jgi:hypothetical protein